MVSVIIPTYNVEQYIGRCLDSVLNQSYKNIEIVIVDDASSDQSLVIAKQYQSLHHNIRIIKHEQNKGLMTTRRDGYMAALGDCIMFVDSDDALPTDAVQKLVCRQAETNADIVMGDLLKTYVSGRTERRIGSMPYDTSRIDVLAALISNDIIHSLCGKLYKTSLFRENDLLYFDNLTIGEDGCLLYQLVAKADIITSLCEITYLYYVNKNSSSQHCYGVEQIESIIIAYKAIAQVCQPYTQLHQRLQKRLTQAMFALFFDSISIKKVMGLLHKHNMQEYGSAAYAIKFLRASDWWYFVKRFAYTRTMKTK